MAGVNDSGGRQGVETSAYRCMQSIPAAAGKVATTNFFAEERVTAEE